MKIEFISQFLIPLKSVNLTFSSILLTILLPFNLTILFILCFPFLHKNINQSVMSTNNLLTFILLVRLFALKEITTKQFVLSLKEQKIKQITSKAKKKYNRIKYFNKAKHNKVK